jgi:hypothetical protein
MFLNGLSLPSFIWYGSAATGLWSRSRNVISRGVVPSITNFFVARNRYIILEFRRALLPHDGPVTCLNLQLTANFPIGDLLAINSCLDRPGQ